MTGTIQILEKSIAEKIKNFREDSNICEFDEKHVDTWVKQFPEEEREIVLTETDSLLGHNYFGKNRINEFFECIWNTKKIMGEYPREFIKQIQFLNIQTKGHSQERLIKLLEDYYIQVKEVAINTCNDVNIKKYVYLDDCMYTGFTLIKDISNWIQNMSPNFYTQLDIVLIGMYNGNFNYIKNIIEKKCEQRKISVKFYKMHEYNNDIKENKPPYDILWPQYIDNDEYVNNYIKKMEEQKLSEEKGGIGFRNSCKQGKESELFTCTQNRIVFEKALLKKGAYICSLSKNGNEKMKPMGYSQGISLGFGAFFATYYNISNNCPLVFWWGDIFNSSSETLGKWYPLLPREIN